MIPKIIHYSWLSKSPFPEHTAQLIAGWKKLLPDYEFMLWDSSKLEEINSEFVYEAVSARKWAFAADVIRLFAVHKYGGFWMDTDIELFKSLDEYLNDKLVIGGEANFHNIPKQRYLTGHFFGAEKEHPFLELCLSYYKDRHFIVCKDERLPQEMRYEMTIVPEVMAKIAISFYGYNSDGFIDEHQHLKEGIHVYPSDFFDSPRYKSMKNVVCIHRAEGGWRPNNENYYKTNSETTKAKDFRYYGQLVLNKINLFLRKHHMYLTRIE